MANKVEKLEARKAALLAKIEALQAKLEAVDEQIQEETDPLYKMAREHDRMKARREANIAAGRDAWDDGEEPVRLTKAEKIEEAERKARLAELLAEA